ncbi:3-isopropylmalate dehydratase [Desulfosporosinus fructosivorans]|uniref:3-isopropylmalate dehydratase n=1 Tax=Desulfosporosinus fructosivorans TaxID=2018669 RepID=A0A4Z0QXN7_9FIRM|nr:aconitase family protein [Desulfosporosinus fructosivorans]TGE35278.1 3-isopropylmalate dehydratase [Desulfosporosinus fructosivorans]
MQANYFYKYIAKAAGVEKITQGDRVEIEVDLALAHDGTGPKLLEAWGKQSGKVYDGHRVLLTVDHAFPAPTPAERSFQRQFSKFAVAQGCVLYNHGEGVLHQIVAEKASLWPGIIIAGADGHVATAGAFGALAFALTPEELVSVLTSGRLNIQVPELLTIGLEGELQPGVLPRDIALYLLWKFGSDMKGKAVGLTGTFFNSSSADARMTICNLLPEAGTTTAFVVPPGDEAGPIKHGVDISIIEAMIAAPPQPTNVRPARELAGLKINVAIAGGCSAGRLEDMQIIATVLQEHPVHPDVTFIVTPASRAVAQKMDEQEISALIRDRGAVIMPPGCGPCPGKHFGVLAEGDVAITTTVKNTPGRIGSTEASIYLASPLTVAQAAVKGEI